MGETNQQNSSEIIVPIIGNWTKIDKKRQKGLNPKKKLMIEALKSQLGNISLACKQIGIVRQTHHNWLKDDPLYKQAYDEIDDFVLDFAENALMKQMSSGNVIATIFFLKCKGKKKGYIEKQEIEHTSTGDIKFIIERQNARISPETQS
jgi:phage-related tail protein